MTDYKVVKTELGNISHIIKDGNITIPIDLKNKDYVSYLDYVDKNGVQPLITMQPIESSGYESIDAQITEIRDMISSLNAVVVDLIVGGGV